MIKKIAFIFSIVIINACALQTPVIANDSNNNDDFEVHKLVIQMNKRDPEIQAEVLSNIVNISKYYGVDNVEIELVAYGPGIYFITKQSEFRKRIESLMMQDVTFTACGDTIKTIKRTKDIDLELIDDVVVVKNGVPRMMDLQQQGYSYLSP
jgi:intracellular sulfur oxidation DsrE/DsrF family protein